MSARPSPLRWLAALLVLVCGLLLAPTAFAAPARDQLRLGLPLEPPNLDPTTGAAAAVDEVLYANVMEGLVRIDADGQIQPALATNWEVSPDGLVYVFHLRSGVRFHNGAQFDASIVKFTLDRARASDSANVQKDALGVIRSVEVIDPQTVKLTLTRASNRLLYVLAWGDCVMVEPNSVKDIAAHPVGTGPFRFGEWRRGDSVTLVRNDAYWGKPAQVRGVVFKFIADPTAAFAAMKAGDLDAFPDFPAPENLAEFKKDPRFRVVVGLTQGETILGINNRSKPLSDVRVRRAIAYAIDRQAIIKAGLFGYGAPIGSHFAPQAQGYVDLTGAYPYNPAKARALLAEAGYPNGFELSLKLPPPFYARRGGEIIASQLAQVGIRVKSENLEWAQWLDQVLKNHNFDLTIVSHTEPMDYDIYGRPDYYFGYQNPEFNRLLAAQDAATDPRQQLELLAAIQRKLSDDAVNAWLFQFPRLGVWRADVRGLWPNSPIQADNVTGAYFEGAQTGGALAAVSRAGSSRAAGWIALGLGLIVLLLAGRKVGARYLAARSGYLIATLIGATLVVFALTQVVPGDPASFMMGLNANPQAVAALRHQLGVDQPIPAQYFHWVSRLLHGDFGTSYTYRVPVAGLIAERLAVSGPLALYAMLLSVLVGVPIGVLAAARRNSAADTGLMALSQIGVATPNFWLAMLLVLSFSMGLRWFSAGGFAGWDAGLGAGLKSLTLPAVALALPQAAIIARVLRSALIEAMGEDYVRTARAKGLSRGQALRRHALRNALVPLLSILGLQFPFLLAGSVIIENVFFLPGIGRLVFQAIVQRDLIVVQSVVMVLVLAVVLVTFLVDIGYAVVDPRLRGRRTA